MNLIFMFDCILQVLKRFGKRKCYSLKPRITEVKSLLIFNLYKPTQKRFSFIKSDLERGETLRHYLPQMVCLIMITIIFAIFVRHKRIARCETPMRRNCAVKADPMSVCLNRNDLLTSIPWKIYCFRGYIIMKRTFRYK